MRDIASTLHKRKTAILIAVVALVVFGWTNKYFSLEQRAVRLVEVMQANAASILAREDVFEAIEKLQVSAGNLDTQVSCAALCRTTLQITYYKFDSRAEENSLSYQLAVEMTLNPIWTESRWGKYLPAKLHWKEESLPQWSVWIRKGKERKDRVLIEGNFFQSPNGPQIDGLYPFRQELRAMALGMLESLDDDLFKVVGSPR